MAKRRKKSAAEAQPAASVQDKIAGCLALLAVKGMDPEEAALRLDGIGFTSHEIAGLLNVNENYVRVAKYRKKKR
jgi:hypothetical protein